MKHSLSIFILPFLLLTSFSVFSQQDPDSIVTISAEEAFMTPQKKPAKDDEKLAAQYFQNKEYDKAAEIYERLYEETPNQFYYTYYYQCLIEMRDLKTAEKFLKKTKKKHPNNLRYYVDLGYIYQLNDEADKATREFEKALDKLSLDRRKITDLANGFILRRQDDYAVHTYLKGRKLMDGKYSFGFELATVYERMGDYEKMIAEYLDLILENESYTNSVQSRLQYILSDDPNQYKADVIRTELLKRTQKDPDQIIFSEMLLWLSIQIKNFEMAFIQAKSLDRRFKMEGQPVFNLANLCASNESWEIAIDAYQYLINKGPESIYYLGSKVRMLDVSYKRITQTTDFDQQDLLKLEKDYISAIDELGKNASTVSLLINLSHIRAFYLDKIKEAIDMLQEAVQLSAAYPDIQAKAKLELADVLLFTDDVWEASLLYSQVEKRFKEDALGHEAKFRNARLSYYIGEFSWAKAQLDVLKSATSKLIANDALELSLLISDNIDLDSSTAQLEVFARADLLLYRNKYQQALLTLDSVNMLSLSHPLFDEVIFKKAEIYIETGEYELADSLLDKVIQFYPYDILADNALLLSGEINDRYLKDTLKALESYQQLMTDYPGSLFTVEARKRFRALRGDIIN